MKYPYHTLGDPWVKPRIRRRGKKFTVYYGHVRVHCATRKAADAILAALNDWHDNHPQAKDK